jgi:hypothetical protein
MKNCRYGTLYGSESFNAREVIATQRCIDRKLHAGLATGLCISKHESGLNPYAKNPYSTASGIFQFLDSTWSSVRNNHARFFARYKLSSSVFNARSNVMAAYKLAQTSGGWTGPWLQWASYSCP